MGFEAKSAKDVGQELALNKVPLSYQRSKKRKISKKTQKNKPNRRCGKLDAINIEN